MSDEKKPDVEPVEDSGTTPVAPEATATPEATVISSSALADSSTVLAESAAVSPGSTAAAGSATAAAHADDDAPTARAVFAEPTTDELNVQHGTPVPTAPISGDAPTNPHTKVLPGDVFEPFSEPALAGVALGADPAAAPASLPSGV
ncbi:MAG: hypothetical protein WAW85_12835, partial [Gordonia sp. (in: high G+C Gram-positive bacteria)]